MNLLVCLLDKSLDNDLLKQIFSFICENYSAPLHLLPETHEDVNVPLILAYDKDKIVAVTFFKHITDHLVKTYRTIIKEDRRGQGVGSELNKYMEHSFKIMGYGKITCNIYADNLPSLNLKLKQGYVIEGYSRDHDFEGKHEYLLGKFL